MSQAFDSWQCHAGEDESKTVGSIQYDQSGLIAKRSNDFIELFTQLILLIGRNFPPLRHDSLFTLSDVIN